MQDYLERELYDLIKKDESIFRLVQDYALDGLWMWNLEIQERKWANRAFWATLGYDNHTVSNSLSWYNYINLQDFKILKNYLNLDIKNHIQSGNQIIRYTHRLGYTISTNFKYKIVFNTAGVPIRLLGAHRNVTSLEETQQRLRNQVEKYKYIIEGTNVGTWEWNVQTGVTTFNGRFFEILGHPPLRSNVSIMDTLRTYIHPYDLEKSDVLLQKHFAEETPFYECEVRLHNKNGDWIWFHYRGKVVSWTPEGEPEWMIGSYKEITQSTKEFKQHQEFISQAPTAIAMFDTNMCYLAYSKKWLTDFDLPDKTIIGKCHYAVFPEIGERWKKDYKECLEGKVLKSDEDYFIRQDGSSQWITWELRPWHTDTGKIGGVIIYSADITKRKAAEIKLRVSEEIFRGNFENAAIGMAIVGLKGKWKKVNTSICDMLGYTSDELYNLTIQEVTHPEDIQIGDKKMPELLSGKIPYIHLEKRYLHKNRNIVYTILSTSLVRDEDGNPKHFLTQITDITPRVHAKDKMQLALAKLEGLFEASSRVSIIAMDPSGIITSFNKGAENLLGYTKEEVLYQKTPLIIHSKEEIFKRGEELSTIFKTKIEGFEVLIALAKTGAHDTQEWTQIRKDGSRFPVQLTVTAIQDKKRDKIIGYLAVGMEISKIKKVEKEAKTLLQVTKDQNDRLINFAHIVSHNLKSHSGNFSMLLELFLIENEWLKNNEMIRLLKRASGNLSETIEHLNEVVQINTAMNQSLVTLNLNDVVTKTLDGLSGIASEASVTIRNAVDTKATVLGVPAYLDSILLNFISNGIKYRSPKRKSHVILSTNKEDDFLVLNIEDNGLGIDLKKYEQKLFGMYKTFHHNKDARGIGLFISKNQVEALGGKIKVESKVDKGTTFKIYMKYEKN